MSRDKLIYRKGDEMRTRKVKYNSKAYRLYDYNKMAQMSDGSLASYKNYNNLKELASANKEYCHGLSIEEE